MEVNSNVHRSIIIVILISILYFSYALPYAITKTGVDAQSTTGSTNGIPNSSEANNLAQLIINAATVIATGGVGIATFIIGLRTYKQSQVLRKKDIMKDIILPLIKDYNSDKLKKAKEILSGSEIVGEKNEYYPDGLYNEDRLSLILRDTNSKPIPLLTNREREIRSAFDSFFDFLFKLEYLINVGVLEEEQITYFQPFIAKVAADKNVLDYMRLKGFAFRSLFKLPLR